MKIVKSAITAALALGVAVGAAAPAMAASYYGGPGSSVTLTTYNSIRTSFGPSVPSATPSTSTITDLSYSINYDNPGFAPGSLRYQLCVTGNVCTPLEFAGSSGITGSTSLFNGRPATSAVSIKLQWYTGNPYQNPTIVGGGVRVTDSVTVSYS